MLNYCAIDPGPFFYVLVRLSVHATCCLVIDQQYSVAFLDKLIILDCNYFRGPILITFTGAKQPLTQTCFIFSHFKNGYSISQQANLYGPMQCHCSLFNFN